ncbi:hypothetical protein SAMN04488513_101674 [Pseudozobellia thermophila]|uniref:Virus attachment protein p12 family protein n=1 Tax=Pseudozobellia thermophila TaxID=192903 RepID=A0A1M6C8R5_9FLAO|nr:hypothetical protein SAMN04488513_101674 [Pseudozobellia thermophila]
MFQTVLVYIVLIVSVAYLVKKFLLPKHLFASKKNNTKTCGQDGCGCS